MALVTARDFQLVPDIQGAVGQGIQTAGQLQQLQGISQARDVNEQTQLLTGQILDQSLPPAQRAEAQRQLTALNPQATQQLQQVQAGEQKALSQQDQDQLRSISQAALQVQALPTDDAKLGFLRRRRAEIVERGGNTIETDNVINLFETGQTDLANQQLNQAINVGERLGFIKAPTEGPAAAKAKETTQKQVNVLRKGISDVTKTFKTTEEATKRIRSVGKKGTAASDMAVVFSFMKILDPGSTVREGEFATAQNAAGIPERVVNAYNNARAGTILGEDQRADFLGQAESLFESQRASTDNQIENLLQQADQDEISRSRVFGKDRLSAFEKRQTERQAQPPAVQPPAATGTQEGATATNPQTGQKVIFTNGQWQPAS